MKYDKSSPQYCCGAKHSLDTYAVCELSTGPFEPYELYENSGGGVQHPMRWHTVWTLDVGSVHPPMVQLAVHASDSASGRSRSVNWYVSVVCASGT